MTIRHSLLALLERGSRYGYQLRAAFEDHRRDLAAQHRAGLHDPVAPGTGRPRRGCRRTTGGSGRTRSPTGRGESRLVRHPDQPHRPASRRARDQAGPGPDHAGRRRRAVVQTQRTATMRTLQEFTRLKAGVDEAGDLSWRLMLDAMVFRPRPRCAGSTTARRASCATSRRPDAAAAVPVSRRDRSARRRSDRERPRTARRPPHPRRRRDAVHALRGVDLTVIARRAGRRDGPVRVGQVDAAQPRRRARRADEGEVHVEGASLGARQPPRAGPAAPAQRRLRLPGPQPAPSLTAAENVALPLELDGVVRRRLAAAGPGRARRGRR